MYDYEFIINSLQNEWLIWKKIWEWNDRIVFENLKNQNLVVKIPKSLNWEVANSIEASTYLEQESLRIRMWKDYFPDWLARCALDKNKYWILYMQKLIIKEWSNFWTIPHNWIIRCFDLNLNF